MDALSFLYIALGVGFLLLVIFACVTMIYVIQILRDVSKITDSVRDTAERVNNYVIQPFALINQAAEHLIPLLRTIQRKGHDISEAVSEKLHKHGAKKHRKDEEEAVD